VGRLFLITAILSVFVSLAQVLRGEKTNKTLNQK